MTLNQLLANKPWSGVQLAEMLQVSEATVSLWRNGIRPISPRAAALLAKHTRTVAVLQDDGEFRFRYIRAARGGRKKGENENE